MIRQVELFVCAVQFLTRLPTPRLERFEPDWPTRSARYFPLVGQIVGAVAALALLAASQLWGGWLPALAAVAAGVLVTGGLHEDGLADAADSLGGHTRERRLAIMKDSRLGTYGALSLGLSLAARVGGLAALSLPLAGLSLVAGHGLARAAAVLAMAALPYAGDPGAAKAGSPARVAYADAVMGAAIAMWPLLLLPPGLAVAGLAAGTACGLVPALLARRLIGGRTGDVLGAIEQMFEVGFVLGVAAMAGRDLAEPLLIGLLTI